ncbi:MAG: M48 family metallopeptidase [Candidatus Rokubacteria bacterium]|nr:M48 family metallopeptidase [Candidatus Rokubacteria bacterium]
MTNQGKSYHRWQFWLGVARLALTVALLAVFLLTGATLTLRRWAEAGGHPFWLQVAELFLILSVALRLVSAPLSWLAGYRLPRRVGLLHQPFWRWALDHLKAVALSGALTLLAAEVIYALLSVTAWWWLWGAAVFFAGSAFLAMVVPLWIVPLFYRLTPLDDAQLRERLLALAARVGVPVVGVWLVDQSRKSRTANAALTGLGRTRRILLFDTLVNGFTSDQVEAVLAHELGHHVHGDVRRALLVQGGLTLVTFWIADGLLRLGSRWLGLDGPADPAGLPLFALIVVGLGLLALPLANGYSRWVERRADDFCLAVTRNPDAFIGAMDRLAELNLAERSPHPVKEFFLFSHPSIARRIASARRFASAEGRVVAQSSAV